MLDFFDEQDIKETGRIRMREYETGATRDNCDDKPDYEGFLSPLVIVEFGKYMHKHRKQADGKMRDSDNWQKGMPLADYMKSMYRHFLDVWLHHRGFARIARESLKEALCALIFNAQGYLHELLKKEMQKEIRKDWEKKPVENPPHYFGGLTDQEQSRAEQKKQNTYRPGCDCCLCRKLCKETR